jgi:hypothetical protein
LKLGLDRVERVRERVVLDHRLDQDQRVQLWHGPDASVDFEVGHLDQDAVLLLARQRVQSESRDPIVILDLGQGDPLGRILDQHPTDEILELRRNDVRRRIGKRKLLTQDLVVQGDHVLVVKRDLAEHEAVQRDPEGPDVGGLSRKRVVSGFVSETLGCGEGGGPGRVGQEGVVAVELVADSEVGDLDKSGFGL